MKKIILGILLTFCFILNVNAAIGDRYTIDFESGDALSIHGACTNCYYEDGVGYVNTFVSVHYKMNYKGTEYPAYCIDPGHQDNSQVKLAAIINSNTNNKYHAGLYGIATSKNAYFPANLSNGVDSYKFASTELALRMWKITTLKSKNGGNIYFKQAIGKAAADILAEKANVKNANIVMGTKCKDAKCFYNSFKLGGEYKNIDVLSGDVAERVLPTARKLFIEGLKKAVAVTNKNNDKTMAKSELTVSTEIHTKKENTKENFVQKNYYDINVYNFTAENYISGVRVNWDTKNIAGNPIITTGYSLDNGKTFNAGLPTDAQLKSVTGNKKIVLELTTTIPRDAGYDCSDINITINYDYHVSNSDKTVLLFEPVDADNGQDFIAIVPTGDNGNSFVSPSYNKTIDICGDNACEYYDPEDLEQMDEKEFEEYTSECCTDLEKLCNDKSNPAQQDYCDLYSTYCGACDTEISIPEACTYINNEGDVDISEDVVGYVNSAVDEDGKSNVKACLLMRKKDEAGNTYKVSENNYCQVYCKEDFEFKLPSAVSINSGTYFNLDAQITGTKSCYTSKIDTEKFEADIKSTAKGSADYYKYISDYNSCLELNSVDYDCFEPTIKYDYAEGDYMSQISDDKKEFEQYDVKETNTNSIKCVGDIANDYSCNGKTGTEKININGDIYDTASYVSKTIKKVAKYRTPSVFYRLPSGAVTTDKDVENATSVDGLPVSIKTEKGRYSFNLSITNIGEYYNKSCSNGRIIGGENSVIKNQPDVNSEYECYYDVNCPECEFECEGPLCEIDQCDGNNCVATCVGNGCAYSEAGLSYAYRTISLNNMNPNNRTLGYNWSNSQKAKTTIAEIEENGENAYNEAEYSFTLTPALITAIKEYNKSQLNSGGYANESLSCNDYTDKETGNTYKNINCESDFISALADGNIGNGKGIKVPENKFTSWFESEYCKAGTCTIKNGTGPSWK